MSFKNVYYDHRSSTMHLWEQINGENLYDKVFWAPYVFVRTTDSDIQTIDGNPVKKKTFSTYKEYYNFCKEKTNIFENKVKPEIQFLTERYHKIPDDELQVAKLKIFTLDIEVNDQGTGMPDILNPKDPITLISIMDSISKKVITFGTKEYTGDSDVFFIHCKSEVELLEKFFNFMYKSECDVITGWFIYGFDIPYILNRTKRLFGEDTDVYYKLSPIRKVNIWKSQKYGDLNVDIAGVHILDYMDVYKWYSPKRLERYQLDYVAKHELGEGKLDWSEQGYESLKQLYEQNWNLYVDYNIDDVKRVDELEDKLGYIKLIQALSLLTKCPMKYYQAMTNLIEGALLTHFRRNNMCAPFFSGGHQETFPAAYVKEPHKGMFEWIVDLDITSSYPTAIITLNMSNETYFSRIIDLPENQVIQCVRNRKFPEFHMSKDGIVKYIKGDSLKKFNLALQKGLFAIAPCGSIFKTKPTGVIAAVEKNIFFKRKEVKGKMFKEEKDSDRRKELFSLQWAIKILLNAMFGITSVPYSRYFNVNLAEAITSCGRHTIKMGEKFVNEYFQLPLIKVDDIEKDCIAYIDTDSLFIKLGEYLEKKDPNWNEKTDDKKIEIILKISKLIEKYIDERSYNETQLLDYNSQVNDFKIQFKQEVVAKQALFVKKKKYAYWMVNEEGTPCDELSVTGLEIVRSDSSEAIRLKLKHMYELIMKGASEDEILKHIIKYKKELKKATPEKIAANIGVNNIDKYLGDGKIEKGTPWHVKGVFNYRMLLKELDLVNKYEDIFEGTKGKVVYVKQNKLQIDTVTFIKWPKEFDEHLIIDYEKMIDNFFLKKIGFLLKPMGKDHLIDLSSQGEAWSTFFG